MVQRWNAGGIAFGGDYNPDIRRYRENIVVYAVPVG